MAEISLNIDPDRVKAGLRDGTYSEEDVRRYLARKDMEKGVFKMEPQQVKEAHKLGYMADQQVEDYINFKEHPVAFTVKDSLKGIGYGVRNASQELNQSLVDFYTWAAGSDSLKKKVNPDPGSFEPDSILGDILYTGAPSDAHAQTGVGGFVEGTSQLMTGFIPAVKALKGLKAVGALGKIATKSPMLYAMLVGLLAGIPVDALLFDPKKPRLANFVEENTSFGNFVTDYLKAGPDDSNAEGRLKNALEGAFIGSVLAGASAVASAGALAGLRVLKGKIWKKHANRADSVAQEIDSNIGRDNVDPGPPPKFEQVGPKDFNKAKSSSKRSAYLSEYSEEELSKMELHTTKEGAGYGLTPEKDLVNVFNNSGHKGAGVEAVIHGISRGAKSLDCFDGFLPKYYKRFGFEEVNRVKWDDQYAPKNWNYAKDGRPDVVFMEYKGDTRNVRELQSRYTALGPSSGDTGRIKDSGTMDSRAGTGEGRGLRQGEQGTAQRSVEPPSDPGDLDAPNPVLEDLGEKPIIEIKEPLKAAPSPSAKDLADQIIKISRGLDQGTPREVGYFNIDKIESTDQVKSIIAEMVNREPKLVPRSLETTERLSRLLGSDSDKLIEGMTKLYGETKNLDVKIKAYHDFFTSYETAVHKLAKEAMSDADYLKVIAHMQQAQEIMRMMKGIQVGTARGLNAHKLSWRAKKFDFDAVPNLREEIEPGTLKKVKDVVDNYKSISDQEARDLYNRNLGRNRFWNGLLEIRQSSLVANPGTWGVNIIGNAGAQAFEIINRSVVTAGRSLVDPRRLSQYGAMYHGLMQGFADSFRLHGLKEDGLWKALKSDKSGNVWKTVKTGDPQLDARTKYGEDGRPFESALGPMSFATQIGFRPLTVMDEFFKTTGYHMEKHYRGMDMALSQTPKGGDFRAAYKDLVTEMPEEIHQAALRFARETSYQLPLSPRMQGLKKFIDILPIRLLFLPFYNVAINIVKFATERSPIGLASKKNWQILLKGGSEALEVVNRITMGTGLCALGAWMYEQGIFLGSFEKSQEPAMRNAGIQQFSVITESGKAVSLNRLDPIVTWLGIGADVARLYQEVKVGDRKAEELFTMFITSTAELLTDKSFLKGMHDLVNLIFGERSPEKWAKRVGGNLLPGAHSVQWVKGQFFEDTRKEIYSYMDALKKNYNQGLLFPNRHAVTGKPIKNIPRLMGMFNVTEVAQGDERALFDMARCGAAMRPMKQEIKGVELDGKQYDRLQVILSELPVMDTLNTIFDNPQFRGMQDIDFKAETYRRIVNTYRKAAKGIYLSEDAQVVQQLKEAATQQALLIANDAVTGQARPMLPIFKLIEGN